MVLITLLSLFSFPQIGQEKILIPNFDKIVHFSFHCGILILGTLFLTERTKLKNDLNPLIFKIFLFSVGYGLVIEFLQYIMPFNRAAEIWDVLANTLGALMGALLIKKYFSLTHKLK